MDLGSGHVSVGPIFAWLAMSGSENVPACTYGQLPCNRYKNQRERAGIIIIHVTTLNSQAFNLSSSTSPCPISVLFV